MPLYENFQGLQILFSRTKLHPLLYDSTAFCEVVSSRAIALTTPTVSVSMSLSSTATNGLATLKEVSRFTDFVLTNKTASIALRLNCLLRSCFVESNRKSPIRRLGIRALSCDQKVHTTDQDPLLRL